MEANTYCRALNHGKPHGKGDRNAAGEREGVGVMVYASGDMYEGQWRAGRREGLGTFHFATGSKYVGQFVAGEYEGEGTYYSANGSKYVGEYKAGKRQGKGTKYYADGDKYEGEWVADKMEGKGTYHFANGNVDVGRFKGDKDVGEGARWSADRATAWRLNDGKPTWPSEPISLEEAARIAKRVGRPVPRMIERHAPLRTDWPPSCPILYPPLADIPEAE